MSDRLARSTRNLQDIAEDLSKRGVILRLLSMGDLDPANPTGKLMLTVLGAVATFEREIMLERQREGIAKAAAEGNTRGGNPLHEQRAPRCICSQTKASPGSRLPAKQGLELPAFTAYLPNVGRPRYRVCRGPRGPTVPLMRNIQLTNPSLDLRGIAQVLSDLRLPTTRGGASHATSVRNLLLRKSTNSGPDSILILESARQAETQGMNRFEAALAAARTRLRPILMTSFAFIFGVIPLAIAARAGAEMAAVARTGGVRRGLGVTLFGLLFTPVFYVHSRQVPLLFGLVTRPRRVP